MTRIRTKALDTGDGGAFKPANRPPIGRLPEAFIEPLREFDDITDRLNEARRKLRDIEDPTRSRLALEAARKADAAASAENARKGKTANTTEHVDALHAEEVQARADVEALAGALKLVLSDLGTVRETQKANLPKIRQAEDTARANLAKATAQATKAADELAATIALREWLDNHLPWDQSTGINVLDIWAPARNTGTAAEVRIPVPFTAVTDAVNNL